MFGVNSSEYFNLTNGAYAVQKCNQFGYWFSVPMRNIYAPLFKQIEEDH